MMIKINRINETYRFYKLCSNYAAAFHINANEDD